MNIQFDYFIIRYLSKNMGFDDKTSQIMASASQFINDSNEKSENTVVSFMKDEIVGQKIYQYMDVFENDEEKLKLYIPRTIHKGYEEFKDFDYFEKQSIWWNGLVPFHYPPLYPINGDYEDGLGYQVESPDNFDSGAIFKVLTDYAIDQYKNNGNDTIEETAIRIGAISHMLAASYAHENLNGFVSYVNDAEVNQVMNGDLASYVTDKYVLTKEEEDTVPQVGQFRIKNVLDDCYLRVNYTQNGFPMPQHTIVDNLKSNMEAAKCIYGFFLKLLDMDDDGYSVWKGTYEPVIKSMLSFRNTNINELVKLWSDKFPNIKFSYSKDEIINRLKDKTNPNYIFGAAIVADDIRKAVIVQDGKLKVTNDKGSISFSSIKYNGDKFTVNSIATAEETERPKMLSMELYNDRGQLLVSKMFNSVDENNSIIGEIENNIPMHKTGYKLKSSLYTSKSQHNIAVNKSMNISFEDSSSLIVCTNSNLIKEDVHEVVVSYNMDSPDNVGSSENTVGLLYPNNADYYNQDNDHMIDIMLPLTADFKLNEDYTFISVKPSIVLTDKNNNFIHCGNEKFNNVTFNEDKDVCTIEFNEDWKNHISLEKYRKKGLELTLKISLYVNINAKDNDQFTGKRSFIWEPDKDIIPTIKMQWKEDAKKR